MNRLKELSEARQVAYDVIYEVNQAVNTLNRARSWGNMGYLFGWFADEFVKAK
ncbi:hypothetical protein ACWOA0_03395 [Ignavigranum ruoffiae]|uniref:Uncharacterized protein n=1 Tax=Ignavigranum ruoffiae TaxID=89093 RepID=A0A1H9EX64_9LACT|nr:hypothetical protein [Ignavigranum ruoffiae]SEQ30314.1 hypothetical protein SAMN04488558_1082 [Ignavigranum ruoffiae]